MEKNPKGDIVLKLMEQFAREMTALPAGDPVVGREKELSELIRILCRKNKNNPALVGEPGVGKTAIVEELARRMAAGHIPVQLRGKRLFALSMASLVAGTKYRGEFEERVRDLLAEIARAGNVILFVDEMHTLIGAGSAEGAIDAANILKPALGRGELQLIGATTCREYRKYIEPDAALERRFRVVRVEEPSREQAVQILAALRPGLEKHHHVRIHDEALSAAVELSRRYLPDRFLPDKALDLLDESAALLSFGSRHGARVDAQGVALAVAERTGIPVGKLGAGERTELLSLEQRLRERIFGQDAAVRAVAAAVRRGRAGLADAHRPAASILLTGPTGVGKTALCKALAELVYGSERAMVRLDMSEFMERHTVSRLLGAPPGYVGHGEGGELTEKVRKTPWCLLLLDELEKAHRDVLSILLQLMEDGALTDAAGRRVDFCSVLLVMTTNAGNAAGAKQTAGFGAQTAEQAVRSRLESYFTPEFLGRLDAVAVFSPLGEPELCRVAQRMLNSALDRAQRAGLRVRISPFAAQALGRRCVKMPEGARRVRHLVQELVEDPLAELLLRGAEAAEIACCGDSLTVRQICVSGKYSLTKSTSFT